MSFAGLVQHAVRRDLARAHLVLTGGDLTPERRLSLAQHLVWMMRLAPTDDRPLAAAMRRLELTAQRLVAVGGQTTVDLVVEAVEEVARRQGDLDNWVRPSALTVLSRQLPWLVDGLDARACEHVTRTLTPRHGMAPTRQRAQVYRYRMQSLWGGTPAEGLAGRPPARIPA